MPIIYHVTTAEEWDNAVASGSYAAASLTKEGFIHCSEAQQVAGVLNRYFDGQTNLVKLVIDTDKLTHAWIREWSPSVRETFPHIYGTIDIEAVIEVIAI